MYSQFLSSFVLEAESCRETCLLISPFVKTTFLKKILGHLDSQVKLTLITRASVYDLATGVSDLAAWSAVWELGGSVRILNDLHAKYYRFDGSVFIGSANLTSRGFEEFGNFELLKKEPFEPNYKVFEETAFNMSAEADINLLNQLKVNLAVLEKQGVFKELKAVREEVNISKDWTPSCGSSDEKDLIQFLWLSLRKERRKETLIPEERLALKDLRELDMEGFEGGFEAFEFLLKEKFKKAPVVYMVKKIFYACQSPDRPFISFGTIKRSNQISSRLDTEVNALFNWLVQILPEEFFDAPPHYHSRLLGLKSSKGTVEL